MVQITFWLSLILGVATTLLGIMKNKKWFWIAGVCIYFFSFLGSWSIGGYTLSIAFILLTLAIGYSIRLIKKSYHVLLAAIIGFALWAIMINTLDDAWWFLPFRLLSELVL